MEKSVQNPTIYDFFNKKKQTSARISSRDFYKQNLPSNSKSQLVESNHLNQDQVNDFATLKSENVHLKLELSEEKKKNEALAKENTKLKSDLIQLRKLYNNACRNYVKKDMKIKMLETKIVPSGLPFEKYKTTLGEKLIKKLRLLDSKRRSDSTFVNKCVQKIYEHEISKLSNKTANGMFGKGSLTPDKKKVIEELFFERLSIEQLDEIEHEERFKRFNTLLNSSIQTIRRTKLKSKYETSEANKKPPITSMRMASEPPPLVLVSKMVYAFSL